MAHADSLARWRVSQHPALLSADTIDSMRLAPMGVVETHRGALKMTPETAALCVLRHASRVNPLQVRHGTDGRIAGQIHQLEARVDGLWATVVTWTETAASMIRAREQCHIVPLFVTLSGRIIEVVSVTIEASAMD